MTDLLISQLAERTGVPATTLRFYESAGLLPAGRTPGGYRVYGADAVQRLGFISAAKRLGLPLAEIAVLLSVWADGSCAEVRDSLRPRLAARIAEAEQRASELRAFTATLQRACEHLDRLPDEDGRCGPQCEFLASEERCGTPIACSLDGAAMSGRIRQWQDLLADAEREPIPGGMRLTMSADRAAQVAGLAAAEQRCCPFFDFRIQFTGQRLYLEVHAPGEAVSMLTGLVEADGAAPRPRGPGASG